MRLLLVALCVSVASGRVLPRSIGAIHVSDDKPMFRGVNLGGWLVMEPWITPSIFATVNQALPDFNSSNHEIVDEWTYWESGPKATSVNYIDIIKQHWVEWVQEEHIANISASGCTHIRIPIGYWYFDTLSSEPWSSHADTLQLGLDQLITVANWAGKYNLKILMDLHGAPGSQNGFDNSGRRGAVHILDDSNVARTKRVIAKLTEWVLDNIPQDVLFGIELLNEPNTFDATIGGDVWQAMANDYYVNGYHIVRNASATAGVVLQTAFKPLSAYDNYMPARYYDNVYLDDHNYQCFGSFNEWAYGDDGWSKHLSQACTEGSTYAAAPLWTFTGEFSLSVTDCTKWLTGIDVVPTPIQQNRSDVCDYYGKPVDQFDDGYKQFLSEYARAQMDAFEKANGWFFWNFRTENSPAWDFLLGWREGWIPKRVDQREPFPCDSLPQMPKPQRPLREHGHSL